MARAAKKEKEVSLETVLWNCRVALRGVGSTEKNRDAVNGQQRRMRAIADKLNWKRNKGVTWDGRKLSN